MGRLRTETGGPGSSDPLKMRESVYICLVYLCEVTSRVEHDVVVPKVDMNQRGIARLLRDKRTQRLERDFYLQLNHKI